MRYVSVKEGGNKERPPERLSWQGKGCCDDASDQRAVDVQLLHLPTGPFSTAKRLVTRPWRCSTSRLFL